MTSAGNRLALCNICKDPVTTFICPDCLATGIAAWLPASLSLMFEKFHSGFVQHFRSLPDSGLGYCIRCKSLRPASICPHCYLVEASHWLRMTSSRAADVLLHILPLEIECTFTECSGCEWKTSYEPVSADRDEQADENLCDRCGDYGIIRTVNGEWVCEECGEE